MEKFKISLFEKEYNKNFPDYYSLTVSECSALKALITKRFEIDTQNIEQSLFSKLSFYEHSNALEHFSLHDVLNRHDILPLNDVYINWSQFEKIDSISTQDLAQYFDDIWFPSAEDIDIFDKSLGWLLYIRHDGCIYFYKQPKITG